MEERRGIRQRDGVEKRHKTKSKEKQRYFPARGTDVYSSVYRLGV